MIVAGFVRSSEIFRNKTQKRSCLRCVVEKAMPEVLAMHAHPCGKFHKRSQCLQNCEVRARSHGLLVETSSGVLVLIMAEGCGRFSRCVERLATSRRRRATPQILGVGYG
jgi:hypothetical protein